MNFSKHECLGQECRRFLEAAEKTVSRSFLCLRFAVSQSITLVERFVCFAEQNALSCGEDVWFCMCGCICVVLDNNNYMLALLAFRVMIKLFASLANIVWRSSSAANGSRLSASESCCDWC